MSDIPIMQAPVTVIPPEPTPTTTEPHATAMPKTTAEEDRHTLGQRTINKIWEGTQATVAVSVTAATLFVAAVLALRVGGDGSASMLLLSNAFFLVIGFYFGRTNHQRIGGVDLGR